MIINFTKMQGCGNDFIVLNEIETNFKLTKKHYQFLADRHFGIGADQLLTVRKSINKNIDFSYIIHNADGSEVEQCGNGARCFARFVFEKNLINKKIINVETLSGKIILKIQEDNRITVDMGKAILEPKKIPFNNQNLIYKKQNEADIYSLNILINNKNKKTEIIEIIPISMGNPHAIILANDINKINIDCLGNLIENHINFPNKTNVEFMKIISKDLIKLRVYERGVGETLACGTGACASVVAGILLGKLNKKVDVKTKGGLLTINWTGNLNDSVFLTGDAQIVFEGQIEIPKII